MNTVHTGNPISSDDLRVAIDRTITKVPDFPTPGIMFYDFSPVLLDAPLFGSVIDTLSAVPVDYDIVAGIDARGFLLASAVAYKQGLGVLAIRKQGKLPPPVLSERYSLEYGTNTLEIPDNSVQLAGKKILIIDDVLATGGTGLAAARLLTRAGAQVVGMAVVLEICALQGRKPYTMPVWSICQY